MILWDRVKKNLDNGFEQVFKVSRVISERTRIEAAVARLLIDKGSLDTKMERSCRSLGERCFTLWEQNCQDMLSDPEVLELLREMAHLKEEVKLVKENIRKVSVGEEDA